MNEHFYYALVLLKPYGFALVAAMTIMLMLDALIVWQPFRAGRIWRAFLIGPTFVCTGAISLILGAAAGEYAFDMSRGWFGWESSNYWNRLLNTPAGLGRLTSFLVALVVVSSLAAVGCSLLQWVLLGRTGIKRPLRWWMRVNIVAWPLCSVASIATMVIVVTFLPRAYGLTVVGCGLVAGAGIGLKISELAANPRSYVAPGYRPWLVTAHDEPGVVPFQIPNERPAMVGSIEPLVPRGVNPRLLILSSLDRAVAERNRNRDREP